MISIRNLVRSLADARHESHCITKRSRWTAAPSTTSNATGAIRCSSRKHQRLPSCSSLSRLLSAALRQLLERTRTDSGQGLPPFRATKATDQRTAPWLHFQPKVDLQLDDGEPDTSLITTARVMEHISRFKDAINIYADGARSTSGRAWSAFHIPLYDVNVALRVADHCTAYAAELTAIYICLQWINTVDQPYFVIYALQSIRDASITARPRLLIDVLERLHDLHVNQQKVRLVRLDTSAH